MPLAVFLGSQGYFSIEVCLFCLSVLSVCLSSCLFVCLSVCLFLWPQGYFSIEVWLFCVSVCLLVLSCPVLSCLSVCLCVCLSVSLPRACLLLGRFSSDHRSQEDRLQYNGLHSTNLMIKELGQHNLPVYIAPASHSTMQWQNYIDETSCPTTSHPSTNRLLTYMSLYSDRFTLVYIYIYIYMYIYIYIY